MLSEGKSPSIILGVCRTVLDVATKELIKSTDTKKEPKGSLFSRIEELRKNGVITEPIKDWFHEIRNKGNGGVHDAEGSGDDAREYIEFLRMFMNMAFSLPERINEKKSRH